MAFRFHFLTSLLIVLMAALSGCETTSSRYVPENWSGYYEGYFSKGPIEGAEPAFFFRLFKTENGAAQVALTYPEKAIPGIWSTGLSSEARNIRIEFYSLLTAIKGNFEQDMTVFRGQWKQQGQEAPIYMVRMADEAAGDVWTQALAKAQNRSKVVAPTIPGESTASTSTGSNASRNQENGGSTQGGDPKVNGSSAPAIAIDPRRPQTPIPPFPYRTEEVFVDQKLDNIRLAGTLTIPKGKGPFPAALLISGSGAHDRDGTMFDHKPFAVIADYFARNGFATLRMDDRQVGKSTGVFLEATTRDFATDMQACFEFLRNRPEIDPNRSGLIGHSEGGLVAPLVASDNKDVAFAVLLGAPGVPGHEIVPKQNALIYRASGASEEMVRLNRLLYEQIHTLMMTSNLSPNQLGAKILDLHKISWDALGDPSEERFKSSENALKERLPLLVSPWFKMFLNYDPRPTLKRVTCPVLALGGEKDLQVPSRDNLFAIDSALRLGGNRNYTTKELPGLNHLFQEAPTGSPTEYEKIKQTFSPFAMAFILKWISDEALPY